MKTEFDIVEIEWFDAQSGMDTMSTDELKREQVLLTKSTGYLIVEDKEKVVVAFMMFGPKLVKHYQIIPRKMVKKITIIRRKECSEKK